MAIIYKLNGVDVSDRVRLLDEGDGFTSAAERGAVGTCGVTIDDPGATLLVKGFQTFTVDDEEAFPENRVWTGIAVPSVMTGRIREQDRTTTSRTYDLDLMDLNELLQRKVYRLNAAKRPTETDLARVSYSLESEALSGLVINAGLFAQSNAGTFLESDLRGRYANDMFAEMAPSAVKNFFVYRNTAAGSNYGQAALFYDRDTSSAYTASISISNDPADIDPVAIQNGTALVYPPDMDADVEHQYEDVYTGVWYDWGNGDPIYATSSAIASNYGITRDAVYSTNRIGRLATAQQAAKDWLNVRAGGERVISVTLNLPNSKVNHVFAGQRIQVKLTEVPGLTSYTWARVRRRSVKPSGPKTWWCRLELFIISTPVGDATTTTSCASPTNQALAGTVTGKWEKLRGGVRYEDTGLEPANASRVIDGLGGGADPQSSAPSFVSSDQQDWTFWQFDLGSAKQITALRVRSNSGSAAGMSYWAYSNTGTTWTFFTDIAPTQSGSVSDSTYTLSAPIAARYWRVGKTATGSGLWFYSGFDVVEIDILGCAVDEAPLPMTGDSVGPETSTDTWDGSNTEGTTAGGFIEGTLVVIQDGTDQTAHVVDQDGETGAYTLDYAPRFGAVIRTRYVSN